MPIIADPKDLANKVYDYIVVGGGTSGLTLAARLSENEKFNVLVLEAGGWHQGDPKIDIPAQFGAAFMNSKYDWALPTVKQKSSNDREFVFVRGKGLGGSSALNFLTWNKPPASDVNAYEKLGNPGWNWEDFQKYSKRAETFIPAIPEISELYPHTYNKDSHGDSGPVQVTIPAQAHTVDKLFQETMVNSGAKRLEDPYGGDVTGTYIIGSSVDPKTWKRSYATAYWEPNQDRPNLDVLLEASVSRILWRDEKDADGKLVAVGVEYSHNDVIAPVSARREILLSAGALKSPQVLELSGIGRPDILRKAGVPLKQDLPGVGENCQEHHLVAMILELDTSKADHKTLDLLFEPGYAEESLKLYAQGKGILRTGITSFAFMPLSARDPTAAAAMIDELEQDLKKRRDQGEISAALAKQYDIQLAALRDKALPDMEIIAFPGWISAQESQGTGRRFVSLGGGMNHPISRGSIHIKSSNPLDVPDIDPNYFGHDFDLKAFVELVKYIRSLEATEPLKSNILQEVFPGPGYSSDQELEEFVKNTHIPHFHTIGTCSMLPREDAGVVDSNLKVYGTKNVRVVDISIYPLHMAAHTQAAAYVVGEKGAEMIKAAAEEADPAI